METINIGFKSYTAPKTIKSFIENDVKQKSGIQCNVKFIATEKDINIFEISSDGGINAFFMIGMAVSDLLLKIELAKEEN